MPKYQDPDDIWTCKKVKNLSYADATHIGHIYKLKTRNPWNIFYFYNKEKLDDFIDKFKQHYPEARYYIKEQEKFIRKTLSGYKIYVGPYKPPKNKIDKRKENQIKKENNRIGKHKSLFKDRDTC